MSEDGYETFYPDFWSLGVLLFAMLFGTVPFKANNMEELHMLIQKGEFTFPKDSSENAKSLINGLIVVDAKKRMTIPEILNHPWLKEISEESETSDDENEQEKLKQPEKEETKVASPSNEEDAGIKDIGANINYVNVDNLFFEDNYSTKLSYTDYCSITEDYYSHHINEDAIKKVSKMGYPRDFVIK
jgi:serine/threonine protein kinase